MEEENIGQPIGGPVNPSPVPVRKKRFSWRIFAAILFAVILVAVAFYYFYPAKAVNEPSAAEAAAETETKSIHLVVPEEVRGIYITASTAGSEKKFYGALALAKARGMNALVVDLKNSSGTLAFAPKDEELKAEADPKNLPLGDLAEFSKKIHDMGFYLIARMPVFEDTHYALAHPALALKRTGGTVWTDRNGLAWLDPASEKVWAYNAKIGEEAYASGFDEIQYDYVRFATDGAISQIVFPIYDAKKETYRQAIGRYFAYLRNELGGKGIPVSADVFGFVTWHQSDLGIGQWYDDAIRTLDYVSPMVYPSHYPSGVLKFSNPAAHPYEIVLDSMKKGNEVIDQAKTDSPEAVLATQRPWLQAFDMGAVYTPEMVMAQVRAARETGCSGFLFWNARNDYSNLPDLSEN